MNIIKIALAAAVLTVPMLLASAPSQAATASQYSARGHGKKPMMSNKPSRAIYHRRTR